MYKPRTIRAGAALIWLVALGLQMHSNGHGLAMFR
jgi:hypothetical protein